MIRYLAPIALLLALAAVWGWWPEQDAAPATPTQSVAIPASSAGAAVGPQPNDHADDSVSDQRLASPIPFSSSAADAASASPGRLPPPQLERDSDGLSLSGVVITDRGEPVYGAPIQLSVGRSLDGVQPLVRTSQATSGPDGRFIFYGLDEAEYRLTIDDSPEFVSAQIQARAGAGDVRLVLREKYADLEIVGQISDEQGMPISGASVFQRSTNNTAATAGSDGRYQIFAAPSEQGNLMLLVRMTGYDEYSQLIQTADTSGPLTIDVVLTRPSLTVTVVGRARGDDGSPVAAERVILASRSANTRYQAVTDSRGDFVIEGVKPANDYRAQIKPTGGFFDLTLQDIVLGVDRNELALTLKRHALGEVGGQMINPDNEPVGNFTLFLRNQIAVAQPITVISDSDGIFFVDQVPVGRLMLQTHSEPRFSISGLRLNEGEEALFDLVLDVGSVTYRGQVLDSQGQPLGGAAVHLAWTHRQGTVVSVANRRVTTGLDGRFAFAGLSRSVHTVQVTAKQHRPFSQEVFTEEGAADVVLTLEQ